MTAADAFAQWLFFHEIPLSPFAIFGAMCVGSFIGSLLRGRGQR